MAARACCATDNRGVHEAMSTFSLARRALLCLSCVFADSNRSRVVDGADAWHALG